MNTPTVGDPIRFPWGVTHHGRFRCFDDGSRKYTWRSEAGARAWTEYDPAARAVPVPITGLC